MEIKGDVQEVKYYLKLGILAAVSVTAASLAVVYLGQEIVTEELFIFALNLQGAAIVAAAIGGMALVFVKLHQWERKRREVRA